MVQAGFDEGFEVRVVLEPSTVGDEAADQPDFLGAGDELGRSSLSVGSPPVKATWGFPAMT